MYRYLLLFACLFTGGSIVAELPNPSVEILKSESYFDIIKVFQSCPIIYSLLIFLSVASAAIWIYSMLTIKQSEMMPKQFLVRMRELLMKQQYEDVLNDCQHNPNFIGSVIATGVSTRKHGPQVVIESMQAEGRRAGNFLWQRISLLNEIAVIAPMLGLLGTVIGLFFAFYETNRSVESITSIFDGLGVAVGTTVVGLVVAILAMIFYTSLKFRVINVLNAIENESLALVAFIESDTK